MTPEQFAEFKTKFGADAAVEMKRLADAVEERLNKAFDDKTKGFITQEKFDEIKKSVMGEELTELNKKLETLEQASKDQGIIINTLKESVKPQSKSFEDFFTELMPQIKALREARSGELLNAQKKPGFGTGDLKAAGVTSIGGSIADQATAIGSPYMPGIGGADLQLFDIRRDENFILGQVNMGRTNQFRLAWINEIDYQGTPDTNIAEGGEKPLTQHRFQVEFSNAKKAAAYIELTEEFDNDVPGLTTAVRRMLQQDVIRQFDTQIQNDVIAAAKPYEITQLNGQIEAACGWDAVLAMMAQVGYYNFNPNTVAMNYLTDVLLETSKDNQDRHLMPPFAQRIQSKMVFANKLAFKKVLTGDLKQYNVDIYKEFSLRVGWINDDFIKNKFCVLGELRYHSYISDARKKAICYDDLYETMTTIDGGSISGF